MKWSLKWLKLLLAFSAKSKSGNPQDPENTSKAFSNVTKTWNCAPVWPAVPAAIACKLVWTPPPWEEVTSITTCVNPAASDPAGPSALEKKLDKRMVSKDVCYKISLLIACALAVPLFKIPPKLELLTANDYIKN